MDAILFLKPPSPSLSPLLDVKYLNGACTQYIFHTTSLVGLSFISSLKYNYHMTAYSSLHFHYFLKQNNYCQCMHQKKYVT